jgi:hypothetical protein
MVYGLAAERLVPDLSQRLYKQRLEKQRLGKRAT